MFSDPLEAYEAIANELVQIAPKGWRSVEIEVDYIGDSSVNYKTVFKLFLGKRISDVDEIMIPDYLFELAKMVSNSGKGECRKIFFKMNNKGNFDVSFEY